MLLWAMCFAIKNRVSFRHEEFNQDVLNATLISIDTFMPSQEEFISLRYRMQIFVRDIIIKYFDVFKACSRKKIPHQFMKESGMKSEIVNLGVVPENPSTCKATIEIIKNLHKYVPVYDDGSPFKTLCHGDQLSVERMTDAKLAMACSENPHDKLSGLVPMPQNFHRRCILLQDSMNLLYNSASIGQEGSLMQIRNMFNFSKVTKRVMDNVNHVVDFWNFIIEAYICLLVSMLLSISQLGEIPSGINTSNAELKLGKLCSKVVDFIWPRINYEPLRNASYIGSDELETELPCNVSDSTLDYPEETIPYMDDMSFWSNNSEQTIPYEDPDATTLYILMKNLFLKKVI